MSPQETPDTWSCDFHKVLNEELDRFDHKQDAPEEPIAAENKPAAPTTKKPGAEQQDAIARAYAKQLVGLAFSGGGIRSATFNLGVLQSLARLDLLGKVDYLSTVSGGGYIGSWLMAWINRRGVKDVHARLRPERNRQAGGGEVEEIHFLRRFSNYLTPKLGWLGADMWTVIAVYLRNLILNFIILSSAFAVVLLLPRVVALAAKGCFDLLSWIARCLEAEKIWEIHFAHYWIGWVAFVGLAAVAFAALAYAAARISSSMRYFGIAKEKNAGREVIENFEEASGWHDQEGNKLNKAFEASGLVWHERKFEDFVLELKFRFRGNGDAKIFIWSLLEPNAKQPSTDKATVIHLAGPDQAGPPTAAIGEQKPVRSAAIEPDWNKLEITSVDARCTVRVNDQTINTMRIDGQTAGVLAIERQAIEFKDLKITVVESAVGIGATQGEVQRQIVFPLLLSTFLAIFLFGFGDDLSGHKSMRWWFGLHHIEKPWSWWVSGLTAGAVSAILVFASRVVWAINQKRKGANREVGKEAKYILPAVGAIFLAAGFGGILVWALFRAFFGRTIWEVLVWGPPSLVGAFLATTVLLIGLLGRLMRDERREWWSRLSAWLLIYSLAWIGIFGVAFYGPVLMHEIAKWGKTVLGAITLGWLASTISGLIAARSAKTGKEESSTMSDILAKVAPYVFVVGFVLLLSWGLDTLLVHGSSVHPIVPTSLGGLIAEQWRVLYGTGWKCLLFFTTGFLAIGGVLSLCLDINQFSMHLLYRNRLGRCYLGASNRLRRAQPFTGFSPDDDLDLAELSELNFRDPFAAPYPIINAALNLVGGKELAWQQRKAASFVFTPRYCGYEFSELPPGYCQTQDFASKSIFSQKRNQVTLATAMAISGAAASPNMGYHSSPAPAFLMTVFNVRLGWWLGNPRKKEGYERSGPLNVLGRLLCELFGLTNERGKYIYLSDGGHFENLGIYELVRRRCRFIVVCDAEEDHNFGFGGLGNAIEKCRSDFGIDIDIDVEPIRRRSEKGHSDWHCAIGTIHYSRVDAIGRDGILVYLKSSLTGDEPTDVLRYAAANPGFPHQSTADQWFDESQFESYRALGFHIAENVFGAIGDSIKLPTFTKEDLFVELAEAWHPPSAATAEAFTKHTRTTVAIYDELRSNPHLAFLSEQIYPEWHVLMGKKLAFDTKKPLRDQLPGSEDLKAGFYLCNSVLQLFEDAYVDLNLEDEFNHPDNRGWMNLFKHWSWSPMLRVTWTICASNYGARFQTFCDRHLGLKIGAVASQPVSFGEPVDLTAAKSYKWNEKIEKLSHKIAESIWTWLSQLSVGSKMIADAALTASQEAPDSTDHPDVTDQVARNALSNARKSISEALAKRAHQPVAILSPKRPDEEWFAAAVLREMCLRNGVEEKKKNEWTDKVAELVLSYAAILADRESAKDFATELNPVERDLIESFFIFNPSLVISAEILRLEITPDPNAEAAYRDLNFPIGFAILAETLLAGDKEPVRRLVYFRVQDHLRRMGLARDALTEIIRKRKTLEADLRKMHPDASEVPTDKDRARFIRIFSSAQYAAEQKCSTNVPSDV